MSVDLRVRKDQVRRGFQDVGIPPLGPEIIDVASRGVNQVGSLIACRDFSLEGGEMGSTRVPLRGDRYAREADGLSLNGLPGGRR